MGQKWGPSATVVGGLIALAVVVALILWFTMISDGGESSAPAASLPENPVAAEGSVTDDALPDSEQPTADTEPIIPDAPAVEELATAGATAITSVSAFDPVSDGGNCQEFNDLASRTIDGDTTTTWRTECYSNQFMGAKRGVGVVVSFDAPLKGDLTVQFANGPYNARFYQWDGDTPPPTLDGWGVAVDSKDGATGETVTAAVAGFDAMHVLVHLLELGPNDLCTSDNPFSGAISEISIV